MVGVGTGEAAGVIVAVSVGVGGMAVGVLVGDGRALGVAVKDGLSGIGSCVMVFGEEQPTRSNVRMTNHTTMFCRVSLAFIRPYYNPYAFTAAL
jgi:hypothetical protein